MVVLFMPYVHVFYNSSDKEGILGFKWMSSFLFALALPSVLVSTGLIIRFLSSKLNNQFTQYFKIISFMIIGSGGFFFAWTFYPMTKDFKPTTYYSILVAFAIGLSLSARYIQNAFIVSEIKFKKIIDLFFKYVYEDLEDKDLINPEKYDDFRASRIKLTENAVKYETE